MAAEADTLKAGNTSSSGGIDSSLIAISVRSATVGSRGGRKWDEDEFDDLDPPGCCGFSLSA